MQPQTIPPVPEDTAAVARAAFPKGNLYLHQDTTLGIYQDKIASLFSDPILRGAPWKSSWESCRVSTPKLLIKLAPHTKQSILLQYYEEDFRK